MIVGGPVVQQRAVKQYGKSFERIVWELAHEGISRSEAANRLGYRCHKSFLRLCEANGWSEWFVPRRLTSGALRSREHAMGMMREWWGDSVSFRSSGIK